jgi:hypothetical protein
LISVANSTFQATKNRGPLAKVQVSGVQTVELLVVDKVQLGRSVVAQVRLLDQLGRVVPAEQLKFVQVRIFARKRVFRQILNRRF